MKQLEASELPFSKILSGDYDFRIPDYQRQYSWTTDEAMQLLDDLEDALDRNTDEPYFLGSIVLVKEHADPSAEVIDGQQRLTTVTILLAVLRDLATDSGIAAEIQRKLVEPGHKLEGLQSKPRLELRPRDREFFRQYIQEPGRTDPLSLLKDIELKTDAQRNIRDNTISLRTALGKWTEERREHLAIMLSQRTFLVVVSTPDLESAHRIFSVMNSRGLDLSPADIFKARVIGAMSDAISEDYTEKWEDAEELLGRDQFSDLFLHIRLIYTKQRSEQSLLREFPEQVLNEYLPDRATEFVDDLLAPYAQAYHQIATSGYPTTDGSKQVNAWFRRLAQLDTNDWRSPALWAVRNHGADPAWLNAFFGKLERLAASMFVRRVYVTPRLSRYLELLRQLDAGHGLQSPAFELDDDERAETRNKLNGDIYLGVKTRKYILLRLDEALANGQGPAYDHPTITVEHVVPQHPNQASKWTKSFTTAEREQWTHRLGNLVILSRTKNSEAQNYDFDTKKAKYFQSKSGVVTFALTSQVLTEPGWTVATITHRQQALMTVLTKLWSLG